MESLDLLLDGNKLGPVTEEIRITLHHFTLDSGGSCEFTNHFPNALKAGHVLVYRLDTLRDAINCFHGLRDFDIAARIVTGNGVGEDIEGLAPEFVDALMTAGVADLFPELKCFRKTLAALPH